MWQKEEINRGTRRKLDGEKEPEREREAEKGRNRGALMEDQQASV